MKTKFEVRFVIYQYNGGGQIKNGHQLCTESFPTLAEAHAFERKVLDHLHKTTEEEERHDFVSSYVWDGYLVKVDGVYQIDEMKM